LLLLGVVQAINKEDGNFNKDDEGLLNILTEMSGVLLRNSLNFSE